MIYSKDGTRLAVDQLGAGPALILVNGALATRSAAKSVAAMLAAHFTVFAYDRRGRGESGDTAPYTVQREVEDLDAVISEAGGQAFVFGHSSGAVLALETARQLPRRIPKLAVYEPPFIIDDSRPPAPADLEAHLTGLISAGRPGEAVEYFMTRAVGMPVDAVAAMRGAPMWAGLEQVARTLPYDAAIMGDLMGGNAAAMHKWAAITAPTLVMDGGDSPAYMHHGAEELARILPHAQHRRLPG